MPKLTYLKLTSTFYTRTHIAIYVHIQRTSRLFRFTVQERHLWNWIWKLLLCRCFRPANLQQFTNSTLNGNNSSNQRARCQYVKVRIYELPTKKYCWFNNQQKIFGTNHRGGLHKFWLKVVFGIFRTHIKTILHRRKYKTTQSEYW